MQKHYEDIISKIEISEVAFYPSLQKKIPQLKSVLPNVKNTRKCKTNALYLPLIEAHQGFDLNPDQIFLLQCKSKNLA